MNFLPYVILIAVIFGLIALCDFLLKKFFKSLDHRDSQTVRLPRYSFILGILMTVFAIFALLYVPRQEQRMLWFGCWVVLVIGLFVLTNFFWTVIWYDDNSFTYRTFPHRAKTYQYGQIKGQRTFAARSGWNCSLYTAEDEIQLYAAMQGLHSFMNKAFFGWCRQKGIDPDSREYDPDNLLYFPELDETD